MKTHTKLGLFAAMTLSAAMLAPLTASAGNPYWVQEELERSRAKVLRAHCMDKNGRCIESKMLSDNYTYRCPMRRLKVSDASGIKASSVSAMFCK